MHVFYRIERLINNLSEKGYKKFIIYPIGKVGEIARTILKSKGLDFVCVDRYRKEEGIFPVDILSNQKYEEYIILLCYVDVQWTNSLKETLELYVVDKSRVYSILENETEACGEEWTVPKIREKKTIYEMPYPSEPRTASLERAAREIYEREIGGNVAEVGVYKGDFAKYINWWFYDRRLYLADTFEGFDEKDINADRVNKFSEGSQDWSDTSVEKVLSIMPNKEKCIIKKGWFPKAMEDVNDEFCFVSLDTDLYQPIYAGLAFFYPKLKRGGYIFVHDCTNEGYKGARQAVLDFTKQQNIGYVILPDGCGTAVITK